MSLDIPRLGLGTYRVTDREECVRSVKMALEIGYRHIDTAEAYQNEEFVGAAIEESSVDRDEVFLATKVLHPRFAEGYDYEDIIEAAEGCFDRLGVDSVDLFYGVHWPGGDYEPEPTFDACAELVDRGYADAIGACNLTLELLDEARTVSDVPIDALQVEVHPLLKQRELREYCDRHDIALVGYGPLGNGAVLEHEVVQEIADDYDVSPAQVSLAWLRERRVAAIPKATSQEHIADNWESRELYLDDDALERIDELEDERVYDPPYAPSW